MKQHVRVRDGEKPVAIVVLVKRKKNVDVCEPHNAKVGALVGLVSTPDALGAGSAALAKSRSRPHPEKCTRSRITGGEPRRPK